MNRSLLLGFAALAVACGSSDDANTGDGGATGGSVGTGATPGNGGATQGNGGAGGSSAGGAANGGTSSSGGTNPGGGTATGGTAAGGTTTGTGGTAPGGAGGTATGGAGSGGTPPVDTGADVLERNKHATRDGNFLQPTLTKEAAAKMSKDTGFNAAFTGDMWASPLYLEKGPNNKGVYFAVTTANDVLALDETTGATVWKKNVGSAPQSSGAGCGSIHPIGLISTPVIDAASGTIYVAGGIGTTAIDSHQVHALSITDGAEKPGWPVTVNVTSGGTTFNPKPQNQRSALSLVNGVVYIAYGGHVGDCGDYHGWVVGIDAKDPTKKGGWATLAKGEAIWAAGGMASDGNGVFAVTGNNTAGTTDHMKSDGEEVVRVTGLGVLDRSDKNLYYPTNWRAMDQSDADFGASSPIVVTVPGSTPSKLVAAVTKDGHLFLLDPANLGGMGGHKVDFKVASGSAMMVKTVPATYTTAQGTYVTLSTDSGAICPSGGPSGHVIMGIKLAPGSPPTPTTVWCAALGGTSTSPIATTTDGSANAIVWFSSNGKLTGVDGDTGKVLYTSTDSCSGVRQWTSPIAVKGHLVVGGDNHLCSWSPH